MLSEKEIALELLGITKVLVDAKQSKKEKDVKMELGILIGLMTALGKKKEFLKSEEWLNFTNNVIVEILEREDSEFSEKKDWVFELEFSFDKETHYYSEDGFKNTDKSKAIIYKDKSFVEIGKIAIELFEKGYKPKSLKSWKPVVV